MLVVQNMGVGHTPTGNSISFLHIRQLNELAEIAPLKEAYFKFFLDLIFQVYCLAYAARIDLYPIIRFLIMIMHNILLLSTVCK